MKPIRDVIQQEALKLIRRHERYAKDLHDEFRRRNRRTGACGIPTIHRPSHWDLAAGFNPYLVRSRVSRIAHSVTRSLRRHEYSPRPALLFDVPKADGTTRSVSVFQIADAAVSRVVYKSVLQKNRSRLSAYSFAYREDLTVHDAIQHIAADVRGRPRVFVAEYDFKKYFDSIYHEHIWRILEEQRFLLTEVESRVLREFLGVPLQRRDEYESSYDSTPATGRGIPQGTSVSLFLANVAAWPLDRALERLGVGFARYADDTLIWSHDYGRICEAAEALNEASRAIGADLNLRKSEGISILAQKGAPAEFKSKDAVEFVGYRFAHGGISIRESAVTKIKRRAAYLIYKNLLEAPKRGIVVPARFLPSVDRDYVVLVYQLRRYLYGDLSEHKLRKYLARVTPRMHYRGAMSFYPLVDDEELLRGLDGWLLHTVHSTLRRRAAILTAEGATDLPGPHGLSKHDLVRFRGQSRSGEPLDLRLPSFLRMARLLKNATRAHGANAIAHPKSNHYYPPT